MTDTIVLNTIITDLVLEINKNRLIPRDNIVAEAT